MTKGQAKLIITQKIQDFDKKYPLIHQEISSIKTSSNECVVYFKNGSKIEAVVSNDNSRGYRGNILVLDEYRMIKEDILKNVLKKFLTVQRQPPYLMKEEYKHLTEANREIYISSCWYKLHWSYTKFRSLLNMMTKTGKAFVCGLNYKLAMEHGILAKELVEAEMNADDYDEISWMMEMDCIFWGESGKSFYKLNDLEKNRVLSKPFYPTDNMTYLQLKKKNKHKKCGLPKQEGELRVVGFDVALMGGKDNDNSVITLIRLIKTATGYERHVVYIEHQNGEHSSIQATRLKQLFYDFEADYLAMDTNGNGISVFEELVKVTYDKDRDEEYPAWTCVNNEKMADRAQSSSAVPLIYSYKAAGSPQLNHEISTSLRNNLQNSKIKLLVSQLEGQEFWSDKPEFESASDEEKIKMLRPYIQTTTMVNETVKLEYTVSGGWIIVHEVGKNRKDRYSSLAYGNYLADELERKYFHKEEYDPEDDIVYY